MRPERKILSWFCACSLPLSACAGEPAEEMPDAPAAVPLATSDTAGAAAESPQDLLDSDLPLRQGRDSLAAGLGPPESVSARVVPNRHVPGATDSIVTVMYPGLRVVYHLPGPGGVLLSGVEVTRDRYLRLPLIGADPAAVLSAFGSPDERTDSTLVYLCDDCVAGDDPVRFVLEGGKVRRVGFEYYVD